MIDLHTHSTASDGELSPKDLVSLAIEKDIDVLALTDHDTFDGIKEGKKEGKIEVAKSMKSKGLDISLIAECTGLSSEQIENL